MHHFTCWTLFISRINKRSTKHDFINALMIHTDNQSDSVQLVISDDLEVEGSIPTGDNF